MLEIPKLLKEFFKKLLFDFDYFSYFMLNGGWAGLLGITFIFLMIRSLKQES